MDGVGLATGHGDGDMDGVIIKDFAYLPEDEGQGGEEDMPFAIWPEI